MAVETCVGPEYLPIDTHLVLFISIGQPDNLE